jgi:hypothetical protein
MTVNDVSEAQDARAAARRIVLDVLAEHGIDEPASLRSSPAPVVDDAAVSSGPSSPSRATARRIVEEVLAAHAQRAADAAAAAAAASTALEVATDDDVIDLVALESDATVEEPPPPPADVLAAAEAGRIVVPGPAHPRDEGVGPAEAAAAADIARIEPTAGSTEGSPELAAEGVDTAPPPAVPVVDLEEEEPAPTVTPLERPSELGDDPREVARRVVEAVLAERDASLTAGSDGDQPTAAPEAPDDAPTQLADEELTDDVPVEVADEVADEVVSVAVVDDVVSLEVVDDVVPAEADEAAGSTPSATERLPIDDGWSGNARGGETAPVPSVASPTVASLADVEALARPAAPAAVHRAEPVAVAEPWEAVVEVPETHEAPAPLPPRTGRWLLATVIGAVAIALLFPLAVAALRDLASLS